MSRHSHRHCHRHPLARLWLYRCVQIAAVRARLTTGLTRAINAMNDKYTVRDEWMFALPLLHAVTDSTDPCGLGGIEVGDSKPPRYRWHLGCILLKMPTRCRC